MYKYFTKERKNMRSQTGITMIGLVMYVTCFLVITGVVAAITLFFYGNSSLMSAELYSAADYNKLNLYLVKESEQKGNRVSEIALSNKQMGLEDVDKNIQYIIFSNGDRFTLDSDNHLLYFNSVCLCEDVQSMKATLDYSSGKEVLSIKIGFTNKSYACKYTMFQ